MNKWKTIDALRMYTAVLALLVGVLPVAAQSSGGSIAGTVQDTQGAAIARAQISAINEQTGVKYGAVSSGAGDYRFPLLELGSYTVKIMAPGFEANVQKGVLVTLSNTIALSIKLTPGAVSETVTVDASAPSVQTESSDIGTTITEREVTELPLALNSGSLRSPQAFVFLAPGTAGPGTAGSTTGTYQSKISGGQQFGDEVLLDGMSFYRTNAGETLDSYAPSVEALSQFKELTSTLPAEYGRTTGGITIFTTKAGVNAFHGKAWEIAQNTDFNANNWFSNALLAQCAPGNAACVSANSRPKATQNDYGMTFSGPVYLPKIYNGRNKTFFFFAWEQLKKSNGGTVTSSVPIAAWRAGDFSGQLGAPLVSGSGTNQSTIINPCTGMPVLAGQIFDPTTTRVVNGVTCRSPFPGNKLTQISPVAANVLAFVPLPNSGTGLTQNYRNADNTPIKQTTMTMRFDFNYSQRSKFLFSYTSREDLLEGGGLRNLPEPVNSVAFNQFQPVHYFRGAWDFVITPAWFNHLFLGATRIQSVDHSYQGTLGTNWDQKLGIAGLSGNTGFPPFSIGEGLSQLGQSNFNGQVDSNGGGGDQLSFSKGRHSLLFGIEYINITGANNDIGHENGEFGFARAQTSAFNSSFAEANSGNSFASFLLGLPTSGDATIPALAPLFEAHYATLYAQDDIKASKSLVLNVGLRWDVDTPIYARKGRETNFSPTAVNTAAGNLPGALVFAGIGPGRNGNQSDTWADVEYKDFAPRIGFAYSPASLQGKAVFRGGYGIYYAPLQPSDFDNPLNAGFAATPNFTSPDGFSPAFNISQFPSFAAAPNLDPTQSNNQSIGYVAEGDGKPGLVQNWTFQLQREVAPDLIFTIGYVGQHSTRLNGDLRNPNNINPQYFSLGALLNQAITSPAAQAAGIKLPYPSFGTTLTVGRALKPFPQYVVIGGGTGFGGRYDPQGQSTFNSLQVTLNRQFRQGISLLSSYTWQKTLTDADSALPEFATGSGGVQNPYDLNGEKSISAQDVPHTFTIAYLVELPIGPGKRFLPKTPKPVGEVIGGWEVGGIQRYESGEPLSTPCGSAIPGWNNCVRYNLTGSPVLSSAAQNKSFNPLIAGRNNYLNSAAFVDANPLNASGGLLHGVYELGTSRRFLEGSRSPNYYDEGFSLIKHFPIYDRFNMELRGEAFNAFNRHIFNAPISTLPTNANFGIVSSTLNQPRILQVSARATF